MTRTVLVAGRRGQVADALSRLDVPGLTFTAVGRPELDLSRPGAIEPILDAVRPAAIVNAAAYTAVDRAEAEPLAAFALNRDAAGGLAAAAARHGLPIVHLSTDYVFSGEKRGPYVETDETGPLGIYGRSKLEGEAEVATAHPDHAILRTAWIYGPHGANFLKTMLALGSENETVRVVADQCGTPTYAPDLAEAIAIVVANLLDRPLEARLRGIFHVAGEGETSRADFAAEILRQAARSGGRWAEVVPIEAAAFPTPARRPKNSALDCRRFEAAYGSRLPPWRRGVARCLAALRD